MPFDISSLLDFTHHPVGVDGIDVGAVAPDKSAFFAGDSSGHSVDMGADAEAVAGEGTDATKHLDELQEDRDKAAAQKAAEQKRALEQARIEHAEYQTKLMKGMKRGIWNTFFLTTVSGDMLWISDAENLDWMAHSVPATLILTGISASFIKTVQEYRKNGKNAGNSHHKLGDLPTEHMVLGENVDGEKRERRQNPHVTDFINKLKMLTVLTIVAASFRPVNQAWILGSAAVLATCGVPCLKSALSHMEYLGEVMEARDLHEGWLNRQLRGQNNNWNYAAQEVVCRGSDVLAMATKIAGVFPVATQNSVVIGSAAVIALAMGKLLRQSVSIKTADYNLDAHVGWRLQEVARGIVRGTPKAAVIGLFASAGRVLCDAIAPLGNLVEYYSEYARHLPVVGSGAAVFLTHVAAWCDLGAGLMAPSLIGLSKGGEILKRKVSKLMCAGLASTHLHRSPPSIPPKDPYRTATTPRHPFNPPCLIRYEPPMPTAPISAFGKRVNIPSFALS